MVSLDNKNPMQSHHKSHHSNRRKRFLRFLKQDEEHLDDGEAYKRKTMSARHRRQLLANIVFTIMCIAAVLIFAFLFWATTTGE